MSHRPLGIFEWDRHCALSMVNERVLPYSGPIGMRGGSMFGLGVGEVGIIAVFILVLFGGKKIPQLGSGLAKGIQNFRRGLKEGGDLDDSLTQKERQEKEDQ